MKIRLGDLGLQHGKTFEETYRDCENCSNCDTCKIHEDTECALVSALRESEESLDYEFELPPAYKTEALGNYKKVYICSPYRGDIETNIKIAQDFCRAAMAIANVIPVAPHLYFPQFLHDDDPDERERGITVGLELLQACSEVWIVGNYISEGMKREIEAANAAGKKIVFVQPPTNKTNGVRIK